VGVCIGCLIDALVVLTDGSLLEQALKSITELIIQIKIKLFLSNINNLPPHNNVDAITSFKVSFF
jgi:hypothetical protein